MAQYPPEELADIHFVYGFCNGNATQSVREYAIRFPDRRHPTVKTFIETHQRFREGTLFQRAERAGHHAHHVNVEEEILDLVRERPNISTRRAAAEVGVSHSTVFRVLREDGQHPFHFTPVHDLLPTDLPLRVYFCRTVLQKDLRERDFLNRIVWTDEAQFTRDGVTNFHNLHEWSHDNPHQKKPTSFQHRFSVNVWAGIRDNVLLGPRFLPPKLNSQNYLQFLIDSTPDLLDDLPIAQRNNLYYQQDGAPAHYGRIVQEWLNHNYPHRWIGRNGPIAWPPRSPDLTPLDFYLWGHLKDLVYSAEIQTREQLVQRIEDAAIVIRQQLQEINMAAEVRKRLQRCLIENGGHIENLL